MGIMSTSTITGLIFFILCVIILYQSPFEADFRNGRRVHVTRRMQVAESSCIGTPYPSLCASLIPSVDNASSNSYKHLVFAALNNTVKRVKLSSQTFIRINASKSTTPKDRMAIEDCLELFGNTIHLMSRVMETLSAASNKSSSLFEDIQTLLSAAMTNQDTCIGEFETSTKKIFNLVKTPVKEITKRISNTLALLKKYWENNLDCEIEHSGIEFSNTRRGLFPTWMSVTDELLLLELAADILNVNVTVAKDGSGNFKNVRDAVAAAPENSTTRYVIYIKAGIYSENVDVNSNKTMIMFIGDGKDVTVIRGNRSAAGGYTTFQSSTVAVTGVGFIARSITFVNDAGPGNYQAVALRSGADLSVFYNCSFKGYQDTLYVHSCRQFYRNCDIHGTVDFIFGNAAVVIQNCTIYARLPNKNQKITVTAQGRDDPNQNTGISIMNSRVVPSPEFAPFVSLYKAYLGRPWKRYSRTVFMQSYIDNHIHPTGWLPWNGSYALETLYYGEYKNSGPGSTTNRRVNWAGYHVINKPSDAAKFTVRLFLQGDRWIGNSGVPYSMDLM